MGLKSVVFLIAILIVLSACQPPAQLSTSYPSKTDAATNTIPQTFTPSPSFFSQQTVQNKLNSLTGLEVENPETLNRRPVMIKVSNYPAIGRPHAGLAYTDIVFDYFIGVGQNRFLAIFYGQDAQSVGPVRSGRLVDIQLVNMYKGILGFGSADEDTREAIFNNLGRRAISNLEAPCPAICGIDTHGVIGVFANSSELSQWYSQHAEDNQRYDLSGMTFNPQEPKGGKLAEQVIIRFNFYNRTEWRYDAASGKYLRWMNDELVADTLNMVPSTERANGQQLAFSNVIILFAKYDEIAPSKHDVEIWGNTTGERAVIFRNGQMFYGKWKTVNRFKPIQFFDLNGNPIPLAPGNSWIVIAGLNSSFKEIKSGQWDLFFALS